MRLFRKVGLEAATALLQGEVQFRHDVVDGGDRFLRFGGEWDFRRAVMDQVDRRPEREALATPLLQPVVPSINVANGLGEGAPAVLVSVGHVVWELYDFDRQDRRQ